ncbi:MAG: hypothetical protein JNL01_16875 [Bdellovibrionales bacterium]|nr:hypothetical protein [Bdellovibrionales bacterium]
MKKKTMTQFVTALSLGLASLGSLAMAQSSLNSKLARAVPKIRVELPGSSGKSASVFYVAGREAAVGVPGHNLKTRTVLPFKLEGSAVAQPTYVTAVDPTTETIEVKAATVMRSGADIASHLVVLVHPSNRPEMFICSPETKVLPKDPRLDGKSCDTLPQELYRPDATYFFPLDEMSKLAADPQGFVTIGSAVMYKF